MATRTVAAGGTSGHTLVASTDVGRTLTAGDLVCFPEGEAGAHRVQECAKGVLVQVHTARGQERICTRADRFDRGLWFGH